MDMEKGETVRLGAFADEGGESLAEVLVAVAIIAIVLSGFLAALSTGTLGVGVVRERVTAQNLARAQLECIKDLPYIRSAYPITYATACAATQLSAYAVELSISYWLSPSFTADPLDDNGMQWITVTVYHNNDESVFTIEDYKVSR